MIPSIGIMVGSIGVTVCLYVLAKAYKIAKEEPLLPGVFGALACLSAVLTIVVLVLLSIGLLASGADATELLR